MSFKNLILYIIHFNILLTKHITNNMDGNGSNMLSMMLPMLLMKNEGDITSKLYNTLIILVVTSLVNILVKHFNHIFNMDFITSIFKKRKVYQIKASIVYKNNAYYCNNVSLSYKAIMHYLYNKIIKDYQSKVKYNVVDEMMWSGTMKVVLFSKPKQVYNLTETIQITHNHTTLRSDKEDFTYEKYDMQLSSTDNDMTKVVEFLEQAISEYDKDQCKHLNTLKIYTLNGFDKDNRDPEYNVVDFITNKTFDNMFFEEKNKLLKRIDFFENECKGKYDRLGIPHPIGMLFHGEPGTGKTSAIKALANYTQRHIILVPVKKINTAEKLKNLFLSTRINGIKVPMDKRLYVFEEIDCSQWKNIVLSRQFKTSHEQETPIDKVDVLAECIKSAVISVEKPQKEEFDISLGDLLELLDGMIEIPGRMLIMTSNHPERLDPALLRPGRIDLQVEFKKMTRSDIKDMYKLWFDNDLPQSILDAMKDYVFSQADIGNLFSTYDQDHILHTLVHKNM